MKIKLTEEQYKRLLVENDKDFLEGKVEFPHIGNKVNKFIVKLFNYIYDKEGRGGEGVTQNRKITQIMVRDFGLKNSEAKLLTHNYNILSSNGEETEFSKFLGEPLEYWGEFKFNTEIPVQAYVTGYIGGYVTGYASNYEEFIDQLSDGEYEDIDSDWSGDIESYPEDAEWDIDEDYAYDRIGEIIGDLKRRGDDNVIMSNIEITQE